MNTTTKPLLLSKRGFKELRKSIDQLTRDQQETLDTLRELDKGHSHEERMAQIEVLAKLESIETSLEEKRQTLAQAKLIPSRRARLKVAIGSVVDLIDQQGRLMRYTIVESIEANPSDGRISAASPLGSTLIGKAAHDIVEWTTNKGQNTLKLVRIS